MRSGGTLLLIALLLLAAGGVWMTLGPDETAPPAPNTADQDSTPEAADPLPGLSGQDRSAVVPTSTSSTGPGLVGRVTREGQPVLANVRAWFVTGVSRFNPTRADYEDGGRAQARAMPLAFGMGQGKPVRTAQTDAQGMFHAPALPVGTYLLWARDEAGRMGFGHIIVPQSGLRQRVDISITNGPHELRVRVLHRAGEPYVGTLNVMASGGRGGDFKGPLGQYETDAQGRATLPGLPALQIILAAAPSEGVMAYRAAISLPHEDELVWTIEGEAHTVKGRVVDADDDQPVVGASVQISAGGRTGGVSVEVSTDSEGRFETTVGAPVRALTVFAEGFAQAQVMTKPSEPTEVRLVRTLEVRGRVLEKTTNRALEGVRVIGAQLERQRGSQRRVVAMSDKEGRFVLEGLPAGQVMVFALGSGWLSDGLWLVEEKGFNPLAVALPATGLEDLELVVVPAARVSGTVLDGTGQPVEGALVTPLRSGMSLIPGRGSWIAGIEGVASTDARGAFTLGSLVPSRTYAFKAKHADKPSAESDDVQLKAGGDNPPIEIRLPAERSIVVMVKDRVSGSAIPGARIGITTEADGKRRSVQGKWFTDAQGRVVINGLPATNLEVRAESARHLDAKRTTAYDAKQVGAPTRVELMLELGVEIRGRLVLPDGVKPGFVSIDAEGTGMNMGYAEVTVSSDGTFLAEGVAPGDYELTARARTETGRFAGTVNATAPADDVRLELLPEGGRRAQGGDSKQVEVELVDSDGRRITRAQVTLLQQSSSQGTSIGQSGFARFKPRRPEDFHIRVRGLPTGTKGAAGTYGPYPVVGGRLRIQLDKGLPIAGRVLDEQGKGLKGVKIQVAEDLPDSTERPDPFQNNRGLGATHTDKDGAFHLGGFRAGPHLLKVSASKAFTYQDPLSVDAGAADLRITLHRGLDVDVTVLDWEGKPVVGALVSVYVKRKDRHSHRQIEVRSKSKTGPAGVAHLEGLDASASYSIWVAVSAQSHPQCVAHNQEVWTAQDESIRLPRAYVTKGIAHDLAGKPVANAIIWYRAPGDSNRRRTRTDKEGRFSIGPDAGPTLELRALSPSWRIGFDPDEGEWTRVEAGREDIELSFDPGVSLVVTVRPWTKRSAAALCLQERGGQSPFGLRSPELPPSGTLRFENLKRGAVYRLWVSPDDAGNYVEETELRADAQSITLTPKRGRTVTGRITVPDDLDVTLVEILAYPSAKSFGQSVYGKVGKDGRYELRGVPEGNWTIRASWAQTFGMKKSARIPADGRVDLTLERE